MSLVALAALTVGFVGIIVSATVLFAADAQEVEIIAEGGTATNGGAPIDLTSYESARTALTATNMVLEFPGATTLANTPLDGIDSIVADDTERAITMVGELDFDGGTVDGALVLDWPNDGGGEPTVSLGLQAAAGGLNLATLDSSMELAAGPVVLGAASPGNSVSAFLAFSTNEQDVSAISAAMDFYPADMTLGGGMVVHGTLDVSTYIPEVGDGVVVTMDGEIGATVDLFNSPTAIDIDKVSLAGSVEAGDMNLPSALSSSAWAIGIEYDATADELTLEAGADLTLSDPVLGDNDLALSASVETNGTAFSVVAGLSPDDRGLPTPWEDALGTDLTVDDFIVTFNTDGAGDSTVVMTGAISGGAAGGDIELTITDTSVDASLQFDELSIGNMAAEIAPAFSGASVDIPPQLKNLKISADIDFSYDSVSDLLQASALGTVSFGNSANNEVSVLVLFSQEGTDAPTGFVAGTMDSIPLGDIIPGLGDDFAKTKLPAVGLRVNDTAVNTADYDGLTQTYLQENFCQNATTACTIPSGVALRGTFPVPESLKGALEELWIDVSQPLVIEGTADVFSGSGTSFDLSVSLPPMTPPDAQDWFVSANLSLSMKSDPNFSFSLMGNMTVKIPDETEPSGHDQVTFFINTTLELNLKVPSISLTVTGGLQGTWDSPAGVEWLRVTQFKIQIQVTVGAAKSSVVVGFRGGAQFCTTGDLNNCASANLKDFDASIAIGVRTPGPGPCNCSIDVGFRIASKAGVSLGDVVTISEQAGDITIPAAVKNGLPEVAVKNIELMISTIDSPELCLTSGVRLTADLYIGETSTGGAPDSADLVGQCRTVQEQLEDGGARCEAIDECYASVLFEMTSAGLFVDASMKNIELGPVAITGAGDAAGPRLSLIVTDDTQELAISGGIKIDGLAKAEGSVIIGDGGFAFSLYVGEDGPNPSNFFQVDASAQFGTDMDPDAIVFNLDVKLILDIQDIVDAIYNDLFGWTGANYLEFRCIRLLVDDLTINDGEIIPTSGVISVGIHVMVQDEDDDDNDGNTTELLPFKLGVDWDFSDDAASNVTGIIGDVFGGFQEDNLGCGLPASINPSAFQLGARPDNLVARQLPGNAGYDIDPEVFIEGQTAAIVASTQWPEMGLSPDTYTLKVTWGDSSNGTPATVDTQVSLNSTNGLPRPQNFFLFDHVLSLPPGVESETRTVKFEVTDQFGDIVFTASSPIKVVDGAPHDLFLGIDDTSPNESYRLLNYSFRPPQTQQVHTVLIDWGDGETSSRAFAPGDFPTNGPFDALADHVYDEPGEYSVSVIVNNIENGKSISDRTLVTIDNIIPQFSGGFPSFKSRKNGVDTPILTGGVQLITIPRGAELLVSATYFDANIPSEPTELTVTIGTDIAVDVPLTRDFLAGTDSVVDNAIDLTAVQDSPWEFLNMTATDKFGGVRELEWLLVFSPDNGLRADATEISGVDIETSSSTFRSPIEPGDPNQASNRGGAIWWEWTPTVSGTYRISDDGSSTVNGGDQNTVMTLYTAGLSQLAQDTEAGAGGITELVTTNVTAGTTYLIGVQPVSGAADPSVDPDGAGPVLLNFALAGIPANDDFGDAIPISLVGGAFPHWLANGTTIAGTSQEIEPSHNGKAANTSVWYTWDSTFAAPFEITVTGDDPRVAVYELDGAIDPTTFDHVEVASNDDATPVVRDSKVTINSEVRTYLIAVDAFSDAKQSDFVLEISPIPLNNDDIADAETLATGVVTVGSNVRSDGAQNEFPASGATNHMVFYEWTAPYGDDDWKIRLDKFDNNTDLRVRAINQDPSRPFPCSDDQDPNTPAGTCLGFEDINLLAGETLTIGIDGATPSDLGGFELFISSSNDFDNLGGWRWIIDGEDVDPITQNVLGPFKVPFTFNNAGATNLSDGELRHGPYLARNTTWAQLDVPESGFYEFKAESLPVDPIDTVMAVYGVDPVWAADPNVNPTLPEIENLVLLGTSDDYKGSSNSHVFLELEEDDIIFIMVDGYRGDIGVFDLSFEKIDVPNDSFANALNVEDLDTDDDGFAIFEPVGIATSEFGEPPHLGTINQPSTWYYLDWPADEQDGDGFIAFVDRLQILNELLPDDIGFAVYKGDSLASLEPVGGSFGGGSNTGTEAGLKLTPVQFEAGNRYYIAAFGNLDVDWTLAIENGDPIVDGDDIGDAIVLNGSDSHSGTNVGAGVEDNEIAGSCFVDSTALNATTWYRWQAANSMLATVSTDGSDFDTQLAAYEATPDGLVEVGCDDDINGSLNRQSEFDFTPEAGAYYYFQVDGWSTNVGVVELSVAQGPTEPPVSFHLLEDVCTPLGTGPLHAGADLDGPPIPGWGDGTTDTITFDVVGDIPADQYPFSPARCEVPPEATAIFASFWVVNPAAEGNIILSAAGVTPTGGALNFGGDGFKNSNGITLPISASGEIDLKLNAGPLNGTSQKMVDSFILQVYGWYGPPEAGNAEYTEAMEYVPVTPCMFLDTRPNREPGPAFIGPYDGQVQKNPKVSGTFSGQGKNGKPGSLTDNTTCGVPEGTTHVMVNTELVQTAGGFMGMQNLDNFFSFVAFNQPQNVPMNNANAVPMPLDAEGEINFLTTGNPGVTTNVRMSVLGYYQPIADPGGLAFVPLTPCAVFDTRANKGAVGDFAGNRVGGQTTSYQVRGNFSADQGGGNNSCGIPLDAVAIDLSLEAVNAVREGNLVVSAAGVEASGGVLNFAQLTPKMNNANAVTVPLSGAGKIDVFTNAGTFAVGEETTQIRGVVTGYYIPN